MSAAKQALFPARWRRHDRPTSPGVRRGPLVHTSGQVGTRQDEGVLAGPSVHDQTVQALHNLEEVLGEAGATLADLVKVTVHVAHRDDIAEMNRAYAAIVPAPWPARTCVVAGLARPELRVEIEGVAVVDGV